MYTKILLLLTILQIFSSITGTENTADEKKVLCYYGALKTTKTKTLSPEDIDSSICTHIVYMHGGIRKATEEVFIPSHYNEHPSGGASYSERLEKLKEANPNLKLILHVFITDIKWIHKKPERSNNLIQSAVTLLNASRFDGLYIKAYPSEAEMDSYATFICEMHAEFAKYGYTVSTLATDDFESINVKPAIQRISRCSSFVSLQLDFRPSLLNTTGILGPLNLTRAMVDRYIQKGYQANKLLIGIPTFGLIFTLMDPTETGLGARVSGPGNSDWELSDGYTIFYVQLAKRFNDTTEGWVISRNDDTNSLYAYNKDGKWVSYEDETSLAIKARYILEKNLGGARFFSIEMDDFEGISGKTFPIIRAVSDTFKQAANRQY